ncbi:MAG: nucleoside-diphosphate kinase, partial [Candidatus Omnitrophica bacterium]|nr:nucleoside-diphosphate kinase [Candidatus Omnitrophota bacterium]
HASSSPEEAEREIRLWFKPEEIVQELYPTQEEAVTGLKRRVWK